MWEKLKKALKIKNLNNQEHLTALLYHHPPLQEDFE